MTDQTPDDDAAEPAGVELVLPDLDGIPFGLSPEERDAGDGDGNDPGDRRFRDEDLDEEGRPRRAMPSGPVLAAVAGVVSRAAWGARPPRQVSHSVWPERGGVAIHYGGDPVRIGSHADCVRRVKAWQDFHMDGRGWSDIAYSGLVCDHGYFFAGRGYGVRTAAQGTNDGNDRFLAICWINPGTEPSSAALQAFAWGIETFRKAGAAAATRPHRTFHDTACPGNALAAYTAANWDGKQIPVDGERPKPPATTLAQMVRAVQTAVHVTVDGAWGNGTDASARAVRELRSGHPSVATIRAAQHAIGVDVDGLWGPNSKAAWEATVRKLQIAFRWKVPGLDVDGAWGPNTDGAFWACRAAAYNKS